MSSDSHGGSPAAWTAVAIIIGGTIVSSVALPLRSPVLFFVGIAVIVLGAVVGKVMSMMGLGQTVAYKDEHDPDYDEERSDAPNSPRGHAHAAEEAGSTPTEEPLGEGAETLPTRGSSTSSTPRPSA